MITPTKNNVLVKLDDRVKQTKAGIVIPDIGQKAEEWGSVVAAGSKCIDLSAGDRVLVQRTQGTHFILNGEDLVILPEQKILAISFE